MTKEDTMASLFVNIATIKDDRLAINEIILDKEFVITSLLGLPPTWVAFVVGINSWKVYPTHEELWTFFSQEKLRISLVTNPEGVSNSYIAQNKGKKSKGPRNKVDISKVECIS